MHPHLIFTATNRLLRDNARNAENGGCMVESWNSITLSFSDLFEAPLLRQTTSELCWLSGGKRGDYQSYFMLYCVQKLCTVIGTLGWAAVVTVLWIHFVSLGPFHCA